MTAGEYQTGVWRQRRMVAVRFARLLAEVAGGFDTITVEPDYRICHEV
jgi:hypothetical protein